MSGNDRYHTYQGQFMPGGSGYSKLSVPKPKTRITLGAHNSLPWVYWHQQTEKTRHTELKQGYHQATQQAHARFLAHSFTHTETLAQQQQWIDWAIWMCQVPAHFLCCRRTQWLFISSPSFSSASRNKP